MAAFSGAPAPAALGAESRSVVVVDVDQRLPAL